jgi:plastocyanin
MKIEAGKFYKMRDGRKVGPMNVPPKAARWSSVVKYDTVVDGEYRGWCDGGCYSTGFLENDLDLIAEWTDEPAQPETGTLAELNVKPGDVVRYVPSGNHHKILEDKHVSTSDGGSVDYELQWNNVPSWHIVSRASDVATPPEHSTTPPSPVRTVTRKEIVPGEYGVVRVYHDESILSVAMDFGLSIAAIDQAIQTLTEIRDALENP